MTNELTNVEKVYRSLNLSMRKWPASTFHGMSEYDENIGLSRSQWSDGIQSNIKKGRILCLKKAGILRTEKLGMYRLVRRERYIDILPDLSNVNETSNIICSYPESFVYLKICKYPRYDFNPKEDFKIWLKVIPESEYQSLQKTAEELNEELPNYVTKAKEPESDYDIIAKFEPKKSFKVKIKVLDIEETSKPKVGDHVMTFHKGIHKIKSMDYDSFNENRRYISAKNGGYFSDSAIKKIIKLPEEIKIKAGEHTGEILDILKESGYTGLGHRGDEHIFVSYKWYYTRRGGDNLSFRKCSGIELTVAEFYTEVGLEIPTKEGKLAEKTEQSDSFRKEWEAAFVTKYKKEQQEDSRKRRDNLLSILDDLDKVIINNIEDVKGIELLCVEARNRMVQEINNIKE